MPDESYVDDPLSHPQSKWYALRKYVKFHLNFPNKVIQQKCNYDKSHPVFEWRNSYELCSITFEASILDDKGPPGSYTPSTCIVPSQHQQKWISDFIYSQSIVAWFSVHWKILALLCNLTSYVGGPLATKKEILIQVLLVGTAALHVVPQMLACCQCFLSRNMERLAVHPIHLELFSHRTTAWLMVIPYHPS